jgi:hypothetical protein
LRCGELDKDVESTKITALRMQIKASSIKACGQGGENMGKECR